MNERITIPLIYKMNKLYKENNSIKTVAKILKIRVNTVCEYVTDKRKQGVQVNKEVKQWYVQYVMGEWRMADVHNADFAFHEENLKQYGSYLKNTK